MIRRPAPISMKRDAVHNTVKNISRLSAKSRTLLVCGNSASLNEMPFEEINRFYVIGTNRLLEHPTINTSILLTADTSVFDEQYANMMKKQVICVTTDSIVMRRYDKIRELQNIFWFSPTARIDDSFIGGNLYKTNNSGGYALCLAARLLQKNGTIGVLGMDFTWGTGASHFFGDGKEKGCRAAYRTTIPALQQYVEYLKKHKNIKVVNLSPWKGPLDAFMPRKEIESIS